MKEVQLIEEEIEVLEDVGRDPKAKVVEDLICSELNELSSDWFFSHWCKPGKTKENRAHLAPQSQYRGLRMDTL